jgi:hypothetical protein
MGFGRESTSRIEDRGWKIDLQFSIFHPRPQDFGNG